MKFRGIEQTRRVLRRKVQNMRVILIVFLLYKNKIYIFRILKYIPCTLYEIHTLTDTFEPLKNWP